VTDYTWTTEQTVMGEKVAVCRDGRGEIVSRWIWSRVGCLIRNTSGHGPGWVRPTHGVPVIVVELLGRQGVAA
jgi:hypothetical protein